MLENPMNAVHEIWTRLIDGVSHGSFSLEKQRLRRIKNQSTDAQSGHKDQNVLEGAHETAQSDNSLTGALMPERRVSRLRRLGHLLTSYWCDRIGNEGKAPVGATEQEHLIHQLYLHEAAGPQCEELVQSEVDDMTRRLAEAVESATREVQESAFREVVSQESDARESSIQEVEEDGNLFDDIQKEIELSLYLEAPHLALKIAEDPSTPSYVLEKLAGHANSDVRIAVAENSNTPFDTVALLLIDPDPDVRYALAENHNLRLELLDVLVLDENPYVSIRAQKTLSRITGSDVLPSNFASGGNWRVALA